MALISSPKQGMKPENLQTYIAQQEANGARIKALSTFSVPVSDGEVFDKFDELIVPIEWTNDEAKGVYFGFSFNEKVVPFSLFTKIRTYLDKEGNLHSINPSGEFVELLNAHSTPNKENFETIIKWLKNHIGKLKMKITPYNNYKNGGYIIYSYELVNKELPFLISFQHLNRLNAHYKARPQKACLFFFIAVICRRKTSATFEIRRQMYTAS